MCLWTREDRGGLEMAKILISSVGAGTKKDNNYLEATYTLENKEYKTSLISDALNQHHNFDKIYLIGTKKSIWDAVYSIFHKENHSQEKEYELYEKKEENCLEEDFLNKIFKHHKVKCFIIDYGINNDELWNNFEVFLKVENYILENDNIYLDITNSFRSLSLMSFIMTQFASAISNKKFNIKAVYYGMYEYSSENNGKSPIVDIKILLELNEWINAINAIKRYSDFDPLVRLLKENKEEKETLNVFNQLNNTIRLSNIAALHEFIKNATKKIKKIEQSSNKIIKLLSPEILKILEELNKEKESDFQYSLSKWFYKNKNYILSYMTLVEAIVTKTCELKFPNENYRDEKIRNKAKRRIDYPYNQHFNEYINEIKNKKANLLSIRNNIVHQSFERKDHVNQDIKSLVFFIDQFESYFKK